MKIYDTIIFDLDGTLINSLEDLKDSVNYALKFYNFPLRTLDEIRGFIGNGVEHLIKRAIPYGLDNPKYNDCLNTFRAHYRGNMKNKTKAYEGIIELLEELSNKNYKLGIVSNKFDQGVKELNDVYFRQYIKVAIGHSEDVSRKPSADGVLKAISELDSNRCRTLYVGDSEVDIETAKNANVICVGVTWGFRDKEVLKQNGAEYIIDRPIELLRIIDILENN